jgi:hypothetical protein
VKRRSRQPLHSEGKSAYSYKWLSMSALAIMCLQRLSSSHSPAAATSQNRKREIIVPTVTDEIL